MLSLQCLIACSSICILIPSTEASIGPEAASNCQHIIKTHCRWQPKHTLRQVMVCQYSLEPFAFASASNLTFCIVPLRSKSKAWENRGIGSVLVFPVIGFVIDLADILIVSRTIGGGVGWTIWAAAEYAGFGKSFLLQSWFSDFHRNAYVTVSHNEQNVSNEIGCSLQG